MDRDFSGGSVRLNFKENMNQFHSVFEFYNFGYLEVCIETLEQYHRSSILGGFEPVFVQPPSDQG